MHEHSTEFYCNAGYVAARNEVPKCRNPYHPNNSSHAEWNQGWDAGYAAIQDSKPSPNIEEARKAYTTLMQTYAAEGVFNDVVKRKLLYYHGFINGLLECRSLHLKEAIFLLTEALPQNMSNYINE